VEDKTINYLSSNKSLITLVSYSRKVLPRKTSPLLSKVPPIAQDGIYFTAGSAKTESYS